MKDNNSKVVFVLNATNNYKKSARALASIRRQNCKQFEIVCVTDIDDIEKNYSDCAVIVKTESSDAFASAFIAQAEKTNDNDYLVAVNYDEIIAPNTAQSILDSGSDVAVFNISRIKGTKFSPRYSTVDELTVQDYVNEGACIWNNAVKAKLIKAAKIRINDLGYANQLILLLSCYSVADKINLSNKVLFYREKLMGKKVISYRQFSLNRKALSKILKRLKKKKMFFLYEYAVHEFVVPQLGKYYTEESFIRRLRKRLIIGKYLGIF